MTLYEISENIRNLVDCIEPDENGVVDTTELDTAFQDLNDKLENLGLYLKELNAEASALAQEVKCLTERKKSKESKAQWLMSYVDKCLQGIGMDKFETAKVKFSYRKGEKVEIDDISQIPAEFLKVSYEPDKTAIKQALKTQEVAGCHLEHTNNLGLK